LEKNNSLITGPWVKAFCDLFCIIIFMKKIKEPDCIELTEDQVASIKNKITASNLDAATQELVIKSMQGMIWLNKMLAAKKLSIKKLARLFGFKTEKKKSDQHDQAPPKSGSSSDNKKQSGHGKNGQDKYPGAKREYHPHETLAPGDRCPLCLRGNLYEVNPGIFINIKGAPPLQATVHEAQKLRCATCGEIFTASIPKEIKEQKYDETADVMIALSRYGKGVPFYRLDKWQKYLGVPLPAGTQWERVEYLGSSLRPIYEYLIKLAAHGKVAFMDDTRNIILDLKRKLKEEKSERTGIYTSGIIS